MLTRRHFVGAALGASALRAPLLLHAQERTGIEVVASFSILADFVANVGVDRVLVASLVGPNGDAHVYSPTPSDARKLAAAKVVFINGLGFEGFMPRLVQVSSTKARVVVASNGITPRKLSGSGAPDAFDPHAWQSVGNAKIYIANIRAGLTAADPDGRAAYERSATAYLDRLDALDRDIRAAVAKIPVARRRIVTTHTAFGYFQDAYGLEFIALEGIATDAEPSARDLAKIIAQLKRDHIAAVFLENVTDPRLLEQIAAETGGRIGGTLYSDALTDASGEAPSYLAMMRHNLKVLTAALPS
jgi:zinc/manganese transport system substrate-binding protein